MGDYELCKKNWIGGFNTEVRYACNDETSEISRNAYAEDRHTVMIWDYDNKNINKHSSDFECSIVLNH
jgi:hypothetical protein